MNNLKHAFGRLISGIRWLGLAASLGLAGQASAGDYDGSPQVAEFIGQMTRDYGFAGEQLVGLFQQAQRKQAILDAISKPAERVKPWKEYRPIFITDARISKGVDFWNQNAEALARAEKEYGVPAQIIVAIIGVETFYGGNTGSWRGIDALSTLCFDYPPRAPFFCQQLRELLLLTREEQVDPLSLKGSYAGAMGLPQFMPGSFRAYAVDFDGDGHINIWSNPTDAIGSVASYFKRHGWTAGAPVVSRAQVKGDQVDSGLTDGLDPVKNVGELRTLGWTSSDVLSDDIPVTAFRFDGAEGDEYWMGLPNFYTITRYNRSAMYAMAVYQLSEQLLAKRSGQ
ncbi:lytic murein transglycosylase B [Pseudomonas sp. LRF_L74]|uniref:lytic murein transglycosylase B n=1 Tax=Pseudomonas sp. LRF_L74 TaxID=3369422 RepID=UPI003F5FBC09